MGKKNYIDNQPKTRTEFKGRKNKAEFKGTRYSNKHIRAVERITENKLTNTSKHTTYNTNSNNIIL